MRDGPLIWENSCAKKANHLPPKLDLTMSDLKLGRLQFSQIKRLCSSNM